MCVRKSVYSFGRTASLLLVFLLAVQSLGAWPTLQKKVAEPEVSAVQDIILAPAEQTSASPSQPKLENLLDQQGKDLKLLRTDLIEVKNNLGNVRTDLTELRTDLTLSKNDITKSENLSEIVQQNTEGIEAENNDLKDQVGNLVAYKEKYESLKKSTDRVHYQIGANALYSNQKWGVEGVLGLRYKHATLSGGVGWFIGDPNLQYKVGIGVEI